jgi:hypothetical protein
MLPVISATPTKPVNQSTSSPSPQWKPMSTTTASPDTVQISTAAQSANNPVQVALQEVTETPAQTANEARSGDIQAQKLLAKEAAAEKAAER